MKMPQKLIYEVRYKVIFPRRTNKIKIRMAAYIAWFLNLLFKIKIEMIYDGEGVKVEEESSG